MANPLFTIPQIKIANKAAGLHFFEPATMRFFRSRVCGRAFVGKAGSYFVTGETGPSGIRRYTVRLAEESGDCGTAPGMQFQQFRDRRTALSAAKFLAAQ